MQDSLSRVRKGKENLYCATIQVETLKSSVVPFIRRRISFSGTVVVDAPIRVNDIGFTVSLDFL